MQLVAAERCAAVQLVAVNRRATVPLIDCAGYLKISKPSVAHPSHFASPLPATVESPRGAGDAG